jgi:hypothetical protein
MANTIPFIQANLQHTITAYGMLTTTVAVKGTDMSLIQEPWYRGGSIMGLNISDDTLFSVNGIDNLEPAFLRGTRQLGCYEDSLVWT